MCDGVFRRFGDRFCRVKQTAPALPDILLPEKDKFLAAELQRKQEHRLKAGPTSDGCGLSWQNHVSDWCRVHKLRWGAVSAAEETSQSP